MQLKPKFYKTAFLVSLGFFLISICLGLFLRLSQVWTIPSFDYKHLLHGHSHITLLGWVFNAFFLIIVKYILPDSKQTKKYSRLFWFTQITIFASLISFPLQGYSPLSIIFSTLFIICSYIFGFFVLKDLKGDQSIPVKFIRWAIYYLFLSSLGPWSLGAIMNLGLRDTDWYPLSIYFYLHFFYNGFFVFSIFGVALKELKGFPTPWIEAKASAVFRWMNIACIPSFLLSVLWTNPSWWLYLIAFLSAAVQLWVLKYMYDLYKAYLVSFKGLLSGRIALLLKISLAGLILKMILQLLSAVPWLAEMIYAMKSYLVIGYIHLVMLGLVSCFLLGYLYFKKDLVSKGITGWAISLFVMGFLGTELLLFGQGTLQIFQQGMIAHFFEILFCVSVFMPVGITLVFIQQLRK